MRRMLLCAGVHPAAHLKEPLLSHYHENTPNCLLADLQKQKTHTMPHTTRISYKETAGIPIKSSIQKKLGYIKSILANETVQKILLFTAIIGLLLVAANLDTIL